ADHARNSMGRRRDTGAILSGPMRGDLAVGWHGRCSLRPTMRAHALLGVALSIAPFACGGRVVVEGSDADAASSATATRPTSEQICQRISACPGKMGSCADECAQVERINALASCNDEFAAVLKCDSSADDICQFSGPGPKACQDAIQAWYKCWNQ